MVGFSVEGPASLEWAYGKIGHGERVPRFFGENEMTVGELIMTVGELIMTVGENVNRFGENVNVTSFSDVVEK